MKQILLTGAAGFIGSRVCELLASSGVKVVGIDNFDAYYSTELKRHRWNRLQNLSNAEFLEMDLRDTKEIKGLFAQNEFDAVINLAAMAGVRFSIENPAKYFEVNALGFSHLIETMRQHGVKQIIQASTSSLYAGLPMPFQESLDVRTPISPYAASKLSAEALGYTYASLHDFDVTILRYFTVYGPAGRPDMAPYRFVQWSLDNKPIKLFGDGNQSRDFTFVDDIAQGTILALQRRLPGFEIINLGGGGGRTSILEMITIIGELGNRKPNIEFLPPVKGDMMHTHADIQKAQKLLGWRPKTSLRAGLEATIRWHIDNASWLQ